MEAFWGALGTIVAMYVLLRTERTELRAKIRALDEKVERKLNALDDKFDRKFDGLVEMLAASGTLPGPHRRRWPETRGIPRSGNPSVNNRSRTSICSGGNVINAKRSSLAGLLLLGTVAGSFVVASPQVLGQDEPQCLGAPATITGDADATPGDGTIAGTTGNDIIIGTEGDDVITADAGDDRICGMGGEDKITGGDGFDRANGGPGEDVCETERVVNCEGEATAPADPAPADPAPPADPAEPSPTTSSTTPATSS